MPVASAEPIPFSKFRQGMHLRVVKACDDCVVGIRLQEMGLVAGTEVTVVKVAPLGDPVEISLRGYRLCLRQSDTHCFEFALID